MELETKNSSKKNSSWYRVTIYRMSDFQKLCSISCVNCKLKEQCNTVNYKNENCVVATDMEKILNKIMCARVSAFVYSDFYVNKHFRFSVIAPVLKQYRKRDNVR